MPKPLHKCHVPTCQEMVKHNIFVCRRHWGMLPRVMQRDFNLACKTAPMHIYQKVALDCIKFIQTKEAA